MYKKKREKANSLHIVSFNSYSVADYSLYSNMFRRNFYVTPKMKEYLIPIVPDVQHLDYTAEVHTFMTGLIRAALSLLHVSS